MNEGESVVLNPTRVFGRSALRATSGPESARSGRTRRAPLTHFGAAREINQGRHTSNDRVASQRDAR